VHASAESTSNIPHSAAKNVHSGLIAALSFGRTKIMAEVKSIVTSYLTDMICDKCGVGEMEPTGLVLTSSPPQYQHQCNNCGNPENYPVQYPFLTQEKE
jgi:hypothetical protein